MTKSSARVSGSSVDVSLLASSVRVVFSPRRLSSQTPWLRGIEVPHSHRGWRQSPLLTDGNNREDCVASATIYWLSESNREMSDRSVPVWKAPAWARAVRTASSQLDSSELEVGSPLWFDVPPVVRVE